MGVEDEGKGDLKVSSMRGKVIAGELFEVWTRAGIFNPQDTGQT